MRNFTIYIILLFPFLFFNLKAANDDIPGRQVVTEQMIKSAGIISLSDIMYLADKWNYSSIDGFTKAVSANNLSTYQRQNIVFLIDGQKYDISIFDVQNINLLPVSISQIDYVEFYTTPQIVNGNFIECGFIHFHTKKPVKGISAFINEIVGNETGDPGPYRYTEYATPNVDKIGPFYATGINYGSKNWFAKASFKHEETFDTDPFISDRVSFLNSNENLKATLNSGFGALAVNWQNGTTNFSGGISNHDEFFFFKPAGYEIPVMRTLAHLGADGYFKLDKNISFRYLASYSENGLANRENRINFNFDLNIKTISATVEGNYNIKYLNVLLGFGADKYEALSLRNIDYDNYTNRKAYAVISYAPSSSFTQNINLYYLKDKNFNSLKGSFSNIWKLNNYNIISSSFSFFEHSPEEEMSYWTWLNRGYNLQKELNIDYIAFGTKGKSKTITADLFYSIKPDSTLSIEVSGNFRYFINHYIEKQSFQYSNASSVFFGPVMVYQDEDLKTAGCGITIFQRISPYVSHKLTYNFQHQIPGSDEFKEAWREIPNHNISYMINYNPTATFGIWAKIKYLSSSVWYNYKYSDSQTNSFYNYELKPSLMLDLSVHKWFFHKTLWLNLLLRNILNKDAQYNPAGVNFTLSDFFQIHFYFDSIPE